VFVAPNYGRGYSSVSIVVHTPPMLYAWLASMGDEYTPATRVIIQEAQAKYKRLGDFTNKVYEQQGDPRAYLQLNVYLSVVLILIKCSPTVSIYADISVRVVTYPQVDEAKDANLKLRQFFPKEVQYGVRAIMEPYAEVLHCLYANPMRMVHVDGRMLSPVAILESEFELYPFHWGVRRGMIEDVQMHRLPFAKEKKRKRPDSPEFPRAKRQRKQPLLPPPRPLSHAPRSPQVLTLLPPQPQLLPFLPPSPSSPNVSPLTLHHPLPKKCMSPLSLPAPAPIVDAEGDAIMTKICDMLD
jgi:hypothetical protein